MNSSMSRRQWLVAAMATVSAGAALPGASALAGKPAGRVKVQVWKDPQCGCCGDWVAHMAAHGFDVEVRDEGNTAARTRAGIPRELGSCHTAFVGGYALEGHVPAADVRRLLNLRPDAIGLAVPGMPIGSPGMDGAAYAGRRDRYDVLLIGRDGRTSVFSRQG